MAKAKKPKMTAKEQRVDTERLIRELEAIVQSINITGVRIAAGLLAQITDQLQDGDTIILRGKDGKEREVRFPKSQPQPPPVFQGKPRVIFREGKPQS